MVEKCTDIETVHGVCAGTALAVTLGRNVRMLRIARHLPKYVFACMAQVSRPHLNAIERGAADVRMSTIERLADALSVPTLVLLCDLHCWSCEEDAPASFATVEVKVIIR